jgi:hypothetical protein
MFYRKHKAGIRKSKILYDDPTMQCTVPEHDLGQISGPSIIAKKQLYYYRKLHPPAIVHQGQEFLGQVDTLEMNIDLHKTSEVLLEICLASEESHFPIFISELLKIVQTYS